MKRSVSAVLAGVVALAAAGAASAQDDEKIRRQALEEKANEAYERSKVLPAPGGKDVFTTPLSNNGLKFKAADGKFEGEIGGRLYVIYRAISERIDAGSSPNTFGVDTARVTVAGTFDKMITYKFEMEGTNKGGATSFTNKEATIGWKGGATWDVKAGLMKEPFSQEETCSSRWIEFAERSIMNRVVPGFGQGVLFTGWFMEKALQIEAGFFNENGVNADANDEKGLAVRARYSPSIGEGQLLRIGLAVTMDELDNAANADITNGDLGGLTVIDFAGGVTLDGPRRRTGLEVTWIMNSLQVRAEYLMVDLDAVSGAADESFQINGWYFQVSYLLTGEAKPIENRVKPAKPFNLDKGDWGAFEVAIRIANLDAGDADGTFIISSTTNQKVQELTLGVNWWWTQNTRLVVDFFNFSFDEDIVFANGDHGDLKAFYVRWQIDF